MLPIPAAFALLIIPALFVFIPELLVFTNILNATNSLLNMHHEMHSN